MNHRLGLHWLRFHPDGEDIPHIERMQYRSIKLFLEAWTSADLCRDLLAVVSTDTIFLARDWALSEQKADMERDPTGTGRRHADEWAQKWREGRVHTPVERTFMLGINEADSNHLQRQINDYNTAFLRRLSEHGLRGAAGSFGVGHPSTKNLDPNGLPDWSHYEDMHRAIVEGQHILVTHEYGMPKNHGWGYWCNRIKHCPWHDVTIVVGECGIDSGVVGDRPNKGWQHYGLTPGQYADWLDVYMTQLDSRVHSVMPFTYDFSHPWQSFDVRPARRAFEAHQWKSPQPIEPPPPPPVIPPGPAVPPSGDLFERSIEWVLSQEGGYQNNPEDIGNWTGCAKGVGELKGTNWGISACSYPHLDIRNLTRQQAVDIYRRDYWQPSGANKYDWPLCLLVLDTGILHGVGASTKWLAEVGPNPYRFAAKRLRVYTNSSNWQHFGAGWINRVARLLEAMA